jgi:hypothetical protein
MCQGQEILGLLQLLSSAARGEFVLSGLFVVDPRLQPEADVKAGGGFNRSSFAVAVDDEEKDEEW